jgi:hypothetical protein
MLSCHNGACNPYALINALSKAMSEESSPGNIRSNKYIMYIVAHIAFLLGQGIGPNPYLIDYATLVNEETLFIRTQQREEDDSD